MAHRRAFARFRTLRPGVEVEIRAATDANELHAAVEAGELDACFSVLPLKEDGPFAVRELMTDPYVLIAPAGGACATSTAGACS